MFALNQIHCVDALVGLRGLPDASVDCVVTSPPYNIRNTTGGEMRTKTGKWSMGALAHGYNEHDDNMPHADYVIWQRAILSECMRVLKADGAIFYNHKWRVQNGLLQDRADIVAGLPVRQIIIWQRSGGINFNDTYFLPTYEVIYLIAKPDFRLADGASSYGDVWPIAQENNNDHPAPFPVELARRCIASTTARLILDPFMGSGTTAAAAKALGRDYLGFELSADYVRMARRRMGDMSASEPLDTLPIFAAMSEE